MKEPSRRCFLEIAGLGIAGLLVPTGLASAITPSPDLLIRGGEVIDPSQQLRAKKDIAVSGGRIVKASSRAQSPAELAHQVFDATGKIVIPGLIDLHAQRSALRAFASLRETCGVAI